MRTFRWTVAAVLACACIGVLTAGTRQPTRQRFYPHLDIGSQVLTAASSPSVPRSTARVLRLQELASTRLRHQAPRLQRWVVRRSLRRQAGTATGSSTPSGLQRRSARPLKPSKSAVRA